MADSQRIAATFIGGSMAGKWSYLPMGAEEYTSPGWRERYTLDHIIWHSQEDDVMSHLVYRLSPLLFKKKKEP